MKTITDTLTACAGPDRVAFFGHTGGEGKGVIKQAPNGFFEFVINLQFPEAWKKGAEMREM